jgi:hypothetical protein
MDGFAVFIDKTWQMIKSHKELNLPDQRNMVANFRCNELKIEALDKIKESISWLKVECEGSLQKDF